jgi:isovaleryl-CoA dehydrogenase
MPASEAVLESIRELSANGISSSAAEVDSGRLFPRTNLRSLGAAGANGLAIPAALGGSGGSLTDLAEACMTIGAACSSTAMVYLMHAVTGATMGAGGGDQVPGALERMADGSALATLAFSEKLSGAHFYAPTLKAERHNAKLTVSGRKSFVTSGGFADFLLLLVQSEDGVGSDTYLLQSNTPGVSFQGEWEGLGMAGNCSISMELKDVELTDEMRVGAPGKAGELIFGVVAPYFLIGLAAVNVGIATAALNAATEHVKIRKYADGSSLAEIQYIQHLVADMDTTTRTARLLVLEASRLADSADPGALVPIMEAKIVATEAAATVATNALKATGGQGYTPSLPVERILRDALAGAVMAPTNAVLRNWVGKALTGLPVP